MELPVIRNIMKSERNSHSPRKVQDNLTIALFLAPAFALFLVFLVYPIFRSVYYSLFNWNGLGPAVDFVGLNNFKQILTDKVFMKGSRQRTLDRGALFGHPAATVPGAGDHGGT